MKQYNKGEWSEFYTAVKILNDKKVSTASEDLKATGVDIKVLQLLLKSIHSKNSAVYDIAGGKIALIVDGKFVKNLSINPSDITTLFEGISSGKGRSFKIPIADKLIKDLELESIKANSKEKADLETLSSLPMTREMSGQYMSEAQRIGFTIKSQVGAPPTLLNTSRATNFIFEVNGFKNNMDEINAIKTNSKIIDRIEKIEKEGGKFKFNRMANKIFEKNLRLIDLHLPEIIANMLYVFYTTRGKSRLKDILPQIVDTLSFDASTEELEYKAKRFISDITLGMTPTTPWNGNSVNGGCIVVKTTGDLVCFTLYDREAFDNFIYNNTSFDTPSSSRHDFGVLYDLYGKRYFNLNIQLRMFK